jgi:hypothetical protein
MATVIVQPKYPSDPLPEVVSGLIAELELAFSGEDVRVVTELPLAHQVTFHEVITIWIPLAGGGMVPIVQASIAVGRWFKKRRQGSPVTRPCVVTICDSNGQVLRRISVATGDDNATVEIQVASNTEYVPPPRLH